MMCYRDMTFCTAATCTNFNTCHRALTDDVQAQARAWWGGDDSPICLFAEPEELKCFEEEQP